MIAAIQRILASAHAAGIRPALHCGSAAYAARALGWGFDLVTISSDVHMLAATAGTTVAQLRGLIAGQALGGERPIVQEG